MKGSVLPGLDSHALCLPQLRVFPVMLYPLLSFTMSISPSLLPSAFKCTQASHLLNLSSKSSSLQQASSPKPFTTNLENISKLTASTFSLLLTPQTVKLSVHWNRFLPRSSTTSVILKAMGASESSSYLMITITISPVCQSTPVPSMILHTVHTSSSLHYELMKSGFTITPLYKLNLWEVK